MYIENAVRQGNTGISCTDVQRKWNAGTRKNVKHIDFKHHKPGHIYSDSLTSMSEPVSTPKMIKDHAECKTYVSSSAMAPLFQLQTNAISVLDKC